MAILKKAVVVGGNSGVGLALSLNLLRKGYEVIIVGINEPDAIIKPFEGKYSYHYCDFQYFDKSLFDSLSSDERVNVLIITAGTGRICGFENLHYSEIKKVLRINTESVLETISCFYNRIRSEKPFYTCVIGSITGWVSSPLFSVYAASKAALCRFCESINIELEVFGTGNRVLNVSPGSVKGTKFGGGVFDLTLLEDLANEIIHRMINSDEIYIPDYEGVYKGVIERYIKDSKVFGLQSYKYKVESGRINDRKKAVIGYLSGTFDLFHVGHLNLLRRAKQQCDYLMVGVHENGGWKGKKTFIPLKDRMSIVAACKYVDQVVVSPSEDSDSWNLYHYDKLFVGSDYVGSERFRRYEEFFKNKEVDIVYFPYTAGVSSTDIRKMLEKSSVVTM